MRRTLQVRANFSAFHCQRCTFLHFSTRHDNLPSDDGARHLVAATSLAVDAGILTRHNLHIIASDGDAGGTVVTRKAAEIAVEAFKTDYIILTLAL